MLPPFKLSLQAIAVALALALALVVGQRELLVGFTTTVADVYVVCVCFTF